RRLERRAEPGPGEPALALRVEPWMEVIGAHAGGEPGALGEPHVLEQPARRVLLVRGVIAEGRHRLGPQPAAGNADGGSAPDRCFRMVLSRMEPVRQRCKRHATAAAAARSRTATCFAEAGPRVR